MEQIKKYMAMRMGAVGNLLTSDICGNHCLFCSNKLNPDSVHTIKVGRRDINDLIQEINYFPRSIHQIVLGETAYNTTEGEFIEYPYWQELIKAIYEKRPDIEVWISTSGNSLTEDKILFLKEYNIHLIYSLHSFDLETRAKITGNSLKRAKIAIDGIDLCIKHQIEIECVRLVIMDCISDKDVYNTFKNLIIRKIPKIEVWLASFSKFKPGATVEKLYQEYLRISEIAKQAIPLFDLYHHFSYIEIMPFSERNEYATIKYIKENSYTRNLGLKIGDNIVQINNINILNSSQVCLILEQENDIGNISIQRQDKIIKLQNVNLQQLMEDIIFDQTVIQYDIIKKVYDYILDDKSHSLLMSGEGTHQTMLNFLEKMGLSKNSYYHKEVINEEFGGNICNNGLITITDYLKNLEQFRKEHSEVNITKLILPIDSFGGIEIDVTGRPVQDLRILGRVEVILV